LTRPQLTALIVASALFMENVDSTVIATSLPAIAADLGSDPIKLKLALTAYLISLATFIPISGWAADRLGARTVFRGAIIVFVAGSIACSLSDTLWQFVGARILQGAGGAMMVPVGRLVVLRATPKAELLSAMAWLTVPALIGPILGPPLGGFITTYFDWRWIFWINVPVGILGVVLVSAFIDNLTTPERRPLDRTGFVLSGVGLAGLVFGLSVLGQNMLPLPVSGAMIVVGALSLAAYLRHARRTPHPLLDLSLLKIDTFRITVLGGTFFRIGVGAIPFLLPLALQIGLGKTPFEAGSLVFLMAIGALAMKVTVKPILTRFGFRGTLMVNGVIGAVFLASLGLFALETPIIVMIGVLLFGGFFRSLQFTALNTLAYADVSEARMSRATSFYSVVQQVSLALGVAVAAALIEVQRFQRGSDEVLIGDFLPAFLVVGAIALCSVVWYARLREDAGAELAAPAVRSA